MIEAEWTNKDSLDLQPTCNQHVQHVGSVDLISRQAAIDAISCNITVTGRQNAELVAATIGSFADRIKALPTIEQDWIPCRKPPTENNAYLVTVHPDYVIPGGGQVDILVWVDDDWFFMVYDTKTARYQITRFPDPVIAWRPLPAPYKEDPHEP